MNPNVPAIKKKLEKEWMAGIQETIKKTREAVREYDNKKAAQRRRSSRK